MNTLSSAARPHAPYAGVPHHDPRRRGEV